MLYWKCFPLQLAEDEAYKPLIPQIDFCCIRSFVRWLVKPTLPYDPEILFLGSDPKEITG